MDQHNKQISLNVLQWNAQSIRPKQLEFEALLNQEKIHVAVISETWLETDSFFKISGYNIFRSDRIDGYGGVAIVTHKSIKAQQCEVQLNNSRIEIMRIKVLNCNHLENIISLYCPPAVVTTQRDWDQIFSLVRQKTIIAGDLNAHHSNWSTKTDSRGGQVFDSMVENNYISLNDGTHTRIKLVTGLIQKSSPDLTMLSDDIAFKFEWKVLNENLGSDHLMIKIKTDVAESRPIRKKRNFKKADWLKYKATTENLVMTYTMNENLQTAYDDFIEIINKAAEESIPWIKVCDNPLRQNRFMPKPYWNSDMSKAVAERRRALANFRRNPTPDNLQQLQNKTSAAQRTIRNGKAKAWHEFCDNIDDTTSSSEMWAKMKWLKGYRIPRNEINQDKAQILLNSLTPDFVSPPTPNFESLNPQMSSPVTIQELVNVIKQSDSAPGIDGISYSMIKHLPISGKNILVALYNKFLLSGFVPSQWKNIKIVPVPKPCSNNNLITSERPIALLSCLCKTLHSIVARRLEWFFEKDSLFSEEMVGFRRSRSSMDSLSRLVTRVQSAMTKRYATVGCFVDIDSAYNNVNVLSLLHTLDNFGVGRVICNYLWGFLHSRQLLVELNNQGTLTRNCSIGLAQGDPLSPLLFNVVTISICKEMEKDVFVSQYADDFVLYSSSETAGSASRTIQKALGTFSSMIEKMGLTISHKKTKVCVLIRGYPRNWARYNVRLTINNKPIQQVDSVKYLGMWIDRNLKWGRHINETRDKTLKFLNVFKVLAGSKWGIHPKHLRRLYISIIRSRLDYGSFLYDTSVKSHLYKLDKVQNQAMRVIGGFIRSTPTHVMESELCLQPLFIRRRYLAGKFWLRSKSVANNNTIHALEILNNLCQDTYWRGKKLPLLIETFRHYSDINIRSLSKLPMYSLRNWISYYNINSNIKTQIDCINQPKRRMYVQDVRRKCSEYLINEYASFYKLFTDGSREEKGCGAAFYDPQADLRGKFVINCDISIMHCELIAISEALSYSTSLEVNKVVILSDSKSALSQTQFVNR